MEESFRISCRWILKTRFCCTNSFYFLCSERVFNIEFSWFYLWINSSEIRSSNFEVIIPGFRYLLDGVEDKHMRHTQTWSMLEDDAACLQTCSMPRVQHTNSKLFSSVFSTLVFFRSGYNSQKDDRHRHWQCKWSIQRHSSLISSLSFSKWLSKTGK